MSQEAETQYRYTEADFDDYHPAPLLLVGPEADQSLIDRQERLVKNFSGAIHERLTGKFDDESIQFTDDTVRNRMHQDEGRNSISYIHRLHKTPRPELVKDVSEEEVLAACELYLAGKASFQQSGIAAKALGMGKWDGADITVIGDFRRSRELAMWDEVSEVTGVDATPRFEYMYGIKVTKFTGSQKQGLPKALRLEMKRPIKTMDDGTEYKGRTFAIIDTSPWSKLGRQVIRVIYSASLGNEDMTRDERFMGVVADMVDNKLPEGIVLGRNERVFGHNPAVQKEILERALLR